MSNKSEAKKTVTAKTPEKKSVAIVNEIVNEITCPGCGGQKTPETTHTLCHHCNRIAYLTKLAEKKDN